MIPIQLLTSYTPENKERVVSVVRQALVAGVTTIQFCWEGPDRKMLEIAKELRTLTKEFHSMLIVNNRLDIALAVEADGLHLGQNDMPIELIQKHIPRHMKLGLTISSAAELLASIHLPIDYYGVGAVFESQTKPGEVVGLDRIREIRALTTKPIVAIGGITELNINAVRGAGADGVAVIGAIYESSDIASTVRSFRNAYKY